jgi:hypothetical protein
MRWLIALFALLWATSAFALTPEQRILLLSNPKASQVPVITSICGTGTCIQNAGDGNGCWLACSDWGCSALHQRLWRLKTSSW